MPTTSPSRKESDLEIFWAAAGFADYVLDGDRRSRRRIFFVNVMPLEDLSRVVVAQRCGDGACGIEKQIYSHRKIRRENKSCVVPLHQFAHAVEFPIPAGRAHNHVLSGAHASFDMGNDRVRSREIDDCINVA